jgi:hypothetical protein
MREALFQLTQIINAMRFFNGELRLDSRLALWHYASYYGVVLNPSLGNHQPPQPPEDHPLTNVVYVYDKQGEQIDAHYQWLGNVADIDEEVALTWWGQIRDYIVFDKPVNPRLAAMVEFYKDQIINLESKWSSLNPSSDGRGTAKVMVANFPTRHCSAVVYQLILLSNALRLRKGELNLDDEYTPTEARVFKLYHEGCLDPSLKDAYSPLSPPELGNPHAVVFSSYGEPVARIHYYNSHGKANGDEYSERAYMQIWRLIRDQIIGSQNGRVHAFVNQFDGEVTALEATYQSYLERGIFLGVEISPEAMEEIKRLCNT